MYQRYGGGNMDEGWTRLMFEQFDVPFKPLHGCRDSRPATCRRSYDVDHAAGRFDRRDDRRTRRRPARPGRRWRGRRRGGAAQQTTPPEYRSGFGADGVKALQAFVQKGGTLLTFGQAGDLPIQRFGLPLRNVVAGLPSKEFWSPGSTLRVRFDNDHPLAYGMPAEGLALFMAGSQVYEVTSTDRSQDVEILATYVDRDMLQSGWLLGEAVIARKAAAVVATQGKGHVVLLGFRPQHRDQTHGTFKLVFNALLKAR